MATTHNNRKSTSYPAKFNQRENRASTHNYSMAVGADDEDLTIATDDGLNYVHTDTTTAGVTVTLPAEEANAGRCITIRQAAGANATTVNDDAGGAVAGVALAAAGDWVELFCTGSAWLITKSS